MSRRPKYIQTLHLDRELPIDRRMNAHKVFSYVLGNEPVALDQLGSAALLESHLIKSIDTDMVERAINDLCNSGNVTVRLRRGVPLLYVAKTYYLHLVEGGELWT